jgi:hypothetical protein
LVVVARFGPAVVRVLALGALVIIPMMAVLADLAGRRDVPQLPGWPLVLARVAFAAVVVGTVGDVHLWRALAVAFRAQQVDFRSGTYASQVAMPALFVPMVGHDVLPQPGPLMTDLVDGVGALVALAVVGVLLLGFGLTVASASARWLRFIRVIFCIGLVVVFLGFAFLVTPLYLPSRLVY